MGEVEEMVRGKHVAVALWQLFHGGDKFVVGPNIDLQEVAVC